MLVAIGLVFSLQQDARQQRVEEQRADAERELAVQRAQDEALQAYLDQMSGLLLERDLRASEEDSEVRTLAQARTLTVLERLAPSRRTAVMQFLVEAKLVQRVKGRGPILILFEADLSGADLFAADLSDPNQTNLQTNLNAADLRRAYLRHAYLFDADLSHANLGDAYLGDAYLGDAYLSGANLSGNLGEANLSGASLSRANLSRAEGITNEELDQQAASLEGAHMPNGQKYEDWIKEKESRAEAGQNSGPS